MLAKRTDFCFADSIKNGVDWTLLDSRMGRFTECQNEVNAI